LKPETISDTKTRNVVILGEHEEITITHSRYSPGERGPDLHVHHEHSDSFYVLEGEMTFELGPDADKVRVGPGGFVAAPPRVAHSFVNESEGDARWLNFHTPDRGFAGFLRTLRAGTPGQWDSFDMPADSGLPPELATVSPPGAGERLTTGRRDVLLKADLEELCVAEWDLDGPYAGPAVHRHDQQVDAFYVIEGELELTMHGVDETFGEGLLADVPRGVDHTFNHRADARARVLNIHAPGRGFADVLRRMAD
jgi:mannose-6-phosphate isomerase-like protein (cupin superfamily)